MDRSLHYEIHVTVKTNEINKFIEECGAIGVKPIVLDLQKLDGSGAIQDVMTSSKVTGNDNDAFVEMTRVSESLQNKDFNVVRKKVETVPWHPKALVHDENSEEGYFETHIPIVVNRDELDSLRTVSRCLSAHMSRNPFKETNDGRIVQMLTLRKSCNSELFKTWFKKTLLNLERNYGFYCQKVPDIEYALYDSNVQHDAVWISQ